MIPTIGTAQPGKNWRRHRHHFQTRRDGIRFIIIPPSKSADIDGDGSTELLARSASGMETYQWENNNWVLKASKSPPFSDKRDWNKSQFYSTIQTADIDGDGSDELLARSASGIVTYKWNGNSWKLLASKSPEWSDKKRWDKRPYYSTIQTADINGDGRDELLARNYLGIETYSWNGSDWIMLASNSPAWSDNAGWDKPQYYRTIQTADIDGDGTFELLARSADGMLTYTFHDNKWSIITTANPELKDGHWNSAVNYETIQAGDIDGNQSQELIARGTYGIRTWSFNSLTRNQWNHPSPYGFKTYDPNQEVAYDYLNVYLTLDSDKTIQQLYNTDANTLSTYQDCLYTGTDDNKWNDWTALPTKTCVKLGGNQSPITPPKNLTLDEWNPVAEEIYSQLGQAQLVSDYFSELDQLYTRLFADQTNIIDAIAQSLNVDNIENQKVNAIYSSVFLAPFKLSVLGGPAGSAVGGVLSVAASIGLSQANTNNYQGKWAQALKQFTTISEHNEDAISRSFDFVAGDGQLMAYIARQKSSGNWNPTDKWVKQITTSEGRRAFATWVYQTLAPSIWKIVSEFYSGMKCKNRHSGLNYYYVGKNGAQDCDRKMIHRGISGSKVSSKQLKPILDSISTQCQPTRQNSVYWEYGKCSIGASKKDFFMNGGGWNFSGERSCVDCE